MRVVALVPDLMDRSRLSAALPEVEFSDTAEACRAADVVIIDLARRAEEVAAVRACSPEARIVCFGPHVDDELFDAATHSGADAALPRSRFFRDIAGVVEAPSRPT